MFEKEDITFKKLKEAKSTISSIEAILDIIASHENDDDIEKDNYFNIGKRGTKLTKDLDLALYVGNLDVRHLINGQSGRQVAAYATSIDYDIMTKAIVHYFYENSTEIMKVLVRYISKHTEILENQVEQDLVDKLNKIQSDKLSNRY